MQAVTYRQYGPPDVLKVEDVARPVPAAGEVLVRVQVSSVTSGDVRMRAMSEGGIYWLPMRLIFGLFRPRNPLMGMEFAGVVAETGTGTKDFHPGDAVFGMRIGGGNAEYVVVCEDAAIARMPGGLTFEEAAVVPFGALSAMAFLRDFAQVKLGQKVLIHGASGAVGAYAVQIAKQIGADVTAICSTANTALVRSLGADRVIDYTKADFTREDATYDVILDTVGGTSFARCKHLLMPQGRHVFVSHGLVQLIQAIWTRMRGGKRVVIGFSAGNSRDDLNLIKALLDVGQIRPVLDRRFRLRDVVEAHRYVQTGRKRGGVALSIGAEV